MNYGTWKQEIKDYLHKKNISDAKLQYFIDKAVSKIDVSLQSTSNLKSVSEPANAADPIVLPADFVAVSVFVVSGSLMYLVSPSVVTCDKHINNTFASGYYIDADNAIQTARTVVGVAYVLDYFAKQPPMSGDADTTPAMVLYPDIYLYAAMFEAGLFLEDFEAAKSYKGLFEEKIEAIRRETWRYRWAGQGQIRSG